MSVFLDGSVENDSGLCLGPDCADRPSNGVSGAMWFGPRLGRRRRSGPVSHVNDDDINTIADAINSGPWALVSYQGKFKIFPAKKVDDFFCCYK